MQIQTPDCPSLFGYKFRDRNRSIYVLNIETGEYNWIEKNNTFIGIKGYFNCICKNYSTHNFRDFGFFFSEEAFISYLEYMNQNGDLNFSYEME